MAHRPVNIDRDTPFLMPPDMRDWVPEDDIVHLIIGIVESAKLDALHLNTQGSGSEQYPPRMMLALLIYCYSMGVFSSRRIERATYRDVGVRFLAGGTHPDHDTICAFRRNNFGLVSETFLHVLKIAREMKLLKLGTISIDGTHVQASASKHKSVSYQRAKELEAKLKQDIGLLMAQAEKADNSPVEDGQRLPKAIARRQKLLAKMIEAQRAIEEQDQARIAEEQAEYEGKMAERRKREEENGGPGPGGRPQPPDKTTPPKAVVNLTDPDSRLMRKTRSSEYRQAYNAQAAVDVDSMLIVATGVTQCANDSQELEKRVHAIDPQLGRPATVLADTGYMNADAMERLEKEGFDLYVAVSAGDNQGVRTYDYRPREILDKLAAEKPPKDPRLLKMREKLQTEEGRRLYNKRKSTSEPGFGIIKSAMGFRQCLLRGLEKVTGEWSLVTLAYNFRRLWSLTRAVA
jgi:transposase